MDIRETASPNLIECLQERHRYANLAQLFGYRPVTYTEIACAGWYRFNDGVFWLLLTDHDEAEVHISSLGNPSNKFFTQELEGAILAEAALLGVNTVIANNIDRRMAYRLKKLGWEQTPNENEYRKRVIHE